MKVQVNVSDSTVKIIDEYAKMAGMSRSAFCSNAITEKLLQLRLIQDTSGKILAEANAIQK